ncbi:MAG: efflux RND transporter permease subunit [Acidobacteriota bacterium]
MRLTQMSIKRPATISMVFLLFVFLGFFSAPYIGVDLYPPVSIPWVSVIAIYPGAGSEEIEIQVVKPIEEAVSSMNKIRGIHSTAAEGRGIVSVEFEMSADLDQSAIDIQKAVDGIRYKLPKDVENPTVQKVDLNADPILILALAGNKPLDQIYTLAKDEIKDRIQHVPGVAQVSLVGGKEREIKVSVDRRKLELYGLTLSGVIGQVGAQNLTVPAGCIDQNRREYLFRLLGEYGSLDEIRSMEILLSNGNRIPLGEIAEVSKGFKDIRSYSRLNGQDAVAIRIQKQSSASTVATADGVIKEIELIRKTLPQGLSLTVARDNSDFIHRSLTDTWRNMFEGILITALVLYLFLREWRSTLIVSLAIPTSLIATLTMMYFAGFSFNILTLLGLTMCIGILVDDSIVVLENIHRHRTELGKDATTAALDGRSEIGMAAVAITMSDVVVFGPIAFMTGMVGQFFKQFGLTVVCATLFSLFVSFTLTPMLASILFRNKKSADQSESEKTDKRRLTDMQDQMLDKYERFLRWALSHRKTIVGACFVVPMLVFMLLPLGILKTEFIPQTDQSQLTVTLEMAPGTSLNETDNTLKMLESKIRQMPDVKSCFSTVGRSGEDYGGENNAQTGNIMLRLTDKNDRDRAQWEIAEEMRNVGQDVAGSKIKVIQPSGVGQPQMMPIQINVSGPDQNRLEVIAGTVEDIVRNTPGAVDVSSTWKMGQPEMQASVDRRACEYHGLMIKNVTDSLRAGVSGEIATKYREKGQETDVRVSLAGANKMDLNELGMLTIMNPAGQLIPLSELASLHEKTGPTEIQRLNRQRRITIKGNLSGRSLGEVMSEIQSTVGMIELPTGFAVDYEGDTRDMEESFAELARALVISIVFVYAILVMLYESYLVPAIRMLSLPLGMVGALLGLAVTGQTLNITSFIGLIMLDGLVAKNSTLLIDYTHTIMVREGLPLRESLIRAGTTRLRPIIMTTVTMIAGMLPTALATSTGSEMRRGMAITLIGGLMLSTVLTLVVIPVAYTLMDDLRNRIARKGRKVEATIE